MNIGLLLQSVRPSRFDQESLLDSEFHLSHVFNPSSYNRGSLHSSNTSHLLLYPSLWLLVPALGSQLTCRYNHITCIHVHTYNTKIGGWGRNLPDIAISKFCLCITIVPEATRSSLRVRKFPRVA